MALISEEYRALNREAIENDPNYAISGHTKRQSVRELSDWGRKEVLDYGCGKKLLEQALGPAYRVHNYDPAVPDCDKAPEPCEVVYCGDVLEHIEPECLSEVLADLHRVTTGVGLFRICLCKSSKTFADGTNSHRIIESHDWWKDTLVKAFFRILNEKPKKEISEITWFLVSTA